MIRKNRPSYNKAPASRQPSGIGHLISALHQNAAAVINAKSQLNGPDQILPADSYITNRRNGCVKIRREENGLGSEESISIPTMFKDISEAYPDTVALRLKRENVWKTWTYEQYIHEVELVSKSFIHLGLHRHHSVAIMGQNSPEWVIANLAAIFAGGISVGMPLELTADDIARVAIDSKADIVVVENEAILKKILLVQHKLPELRVIIQIKGEPPLSDKRRLHRSHKKHILSWDQLMEVGQEFPESRLEERLQRLAINHCCSLVYTSCKINGTPKGIMLSHDNITWCSRMLLGFIRAPGFNRLPSPGEEVMLSYIPHSCISAQTIDIYYTMSIAGTLCFVEDANPLVDSEAFFEAISEVQPTVFFAYPVVYELIYQKLREIRRNKSGLQKLFLDWSNNTLREKHLAVKAPSRIKKLNQWQTSVAKNTICKKYKESLGFSARTVFLSRGLPIAKQVLKFLAGYDMVVHESFGPPEYCGLLTANIPKRYCKLNTAGKAVPGVKIKIVPNSNIDFTGLDSVDTNENELGEIIGWGRNIFMGYLNKEGDTKDVLTEENWLKLGHTGYIDSDNFMVVLGNPETFISLKPGNLVVPTTIEQLVRLELPCVKHAMVVGEQKDYLSVLLTLQTVTSLTSNDEKENTNPSKKKEMIAKALLTEATQRWFRHARFEIHSVADVIEHMEKGLQHIIQAGIDRANQGCKTASQMIMEWRIIPNQFTYQSGEITLDGSLMRNVIYKNHFDCIRSLFCENGTVCMQNKDQVLQRPSHLLLQLSQIQEEDESKTSSRNSIDNINKEGCCSTSTPKAVIRSKLSGSVTKITINSDQSSSIVEEEETIVVEDKNNNDKTENKEKFDEGLEEDVHMKASVAPNPEPEYMSEGGTSLDGTLTSYSADTSSISSNSAKNSVISNNFEITNDNAGALMIKEKISRK